MRRICVCPTTVLIYCLSFNFGWLLVRNIAFRSTSDGSWREILPDESLSIGKDEAAKSPRSSIAVRPFHNSLFTACSRAVVSHHTILRLSRDQQYDYHHARNFKGSPYLAREGQEQAMPLHRHLPPSHTGSLADARGPRDLRSPQGTLANMHRQGPPSRTRL
jgi:hypothetical protein